MDGHIVHTGHVDTGQSDSGHHHQHHHHHAGTDQAALPYSLDTDDGHRPSLGGAYWRPSTPPWAWLTLAALAIGLPVVAMLLR
ncbi:hypothetical protein [Kitasatospora sp. NBC_01266]|jgi:hypothetical protein|uniref:hypothetical protein n=1 Tax=Kitasatospora sp. NBC_01266 TaxID=2903572 RepID=UPI002E316F0B|nr:hypothetical protein [Kitasatospora sp. NBC_01266]